MTKKLYDTNSMLWEFDAQVVSCTPVNDAYAVVLDRTAFYPEGGGQPFDIGTLGDVQVSAVHEKNGEIVHTVSSPLPIDMTVHGAIDGARRLALMQNHSGEHIVSGLVNSRHGFDNTGFHMGHDVMTIDFNGALDADALAEIERLANEAVRANIPVETRLPSPEELAAMTYRSKKALSGEVRIVCIEGIDACACCGTHVQRTSGVGLIKLLNAEKHKNGTRVEMLCGADAFADYHRKHENNLAISRLLSAKPNETPQAVQALLETEQRLNNEIADLRRRIVDMLDEQTEIRNDLAIVFDNNLTADDARRLGTLLGERTKAALVCVGSDAIGYRYVVVSAIANELSAKLNARFNGRGGGKPPLAQGQLQGARTDIQEFWQQCHS